jgi:hypothetical protein
VSSIRLSDDWDEDGWVRVPREITRDQSLSFKAVGLVAFLAGHRAGFTINREFIYASHKDGKDAVEGGLRELREAGYLTVERDRGSDGKVNSAVNYVLHRTTIRETQNVVEPVSGEPATKREQFKRESSLKKTEPIGSGESDQPPLFEASPEVTPAVPARSSSKESQDATELASRAYQLWLENWDGTLNGRYSPSGAEATYEGIKEIAARFDVDPEALMRAAEQASADGKYAVRSYYRPGTPSGARLTRMAQEIATKIYEARNKQINFMAVRARVKTALSGGYAPGDIYRGTIALFEAGKPPTQQLVAQYAETARTNRLAALNSRGKVER